MKNQLALFGLFASLTCASAQAASVSPSLSVSINGDFTSRAPPLATGAVSADSQSDNSHAYSTVPPLAAARSASAGFTPAGYDISASTQYTDNLNAAAGTGTLLFTTATKAAVNTSCATAGCAIQNSDASASAISSGGVNLDLSGVAQPTPFTFTFSFSISGDPVSNSFGSGHGRASFIYYSTDVPYDPLDGTWDINALSGGTLTFTGTLLPGHHSFGWGFESVTEGENGFAGSYMTNGAVSLTLGTTPVPLPAAVWFLLSGIGGIGALASRRRSGRDAQIGISAAS